MTTADFTLYGWHTGRGAPRWIPLGGFQTETEATEPITAWMGKYSAFKIEHTVYRFGELT